MTKKERIADLMENIELDLIEATHENNFGYLNGRWEELESLTSPEFASKVVLSLADANFEQSLVAQMFFTKEVAQLRRERGEI